MRVARTRHTNTHSRQNEGLNNKACQ